MIVGFRRFAQRTRRKRRAMGAAALGLSMVGALTFAGLAQPQFSQADTIAYEFIGNWENPPASVASGTDALAAVWRFDINDDSPDPSNDPVDNNVLTLTAQNAKFFGIPDICLTPGVLPASSLSADQRVLTCNIGTRDQGTAQVYFSGLVPYGKTGDFVSVSGDFMGKTVELPKIPIVNPFVMDAKFDQGDIGSKPLASNSNQQVVTFPWSVRHSIDATPGPSSVSYDLTFVAEKGEALAVSGAGCGPITSRNGSYPFSGPGHPAEQTANFPTCTFVSLGGNKFRLTLSNLKYDGPFPSIGSDGGSLEWGMNVIAAGVIQVQFPYTQGTSITHTASTPTYVAANDPSVTSIDKPANNKNGRAIVRGVWTGGWDVNGTPYEGQYWVDKYRTTAGSTIRSISGIVAVPSTNAICTVLDTKYVTFQNAKLADYSSAPAYTGVTYWYQVGMGPSNILNPASANYNPNAYQCNTEKTAANGWTTTKPADLSTIKAVRVDYDANITAQAANLASLYIDQKVKDNAPLGMDIWVWTSYRHNTTWQHPNREVPMASGTPTPGARYPSSAAGRDVVRIIGYTPVVTKSVVQKEAVPGSEVDYHIGYGLKAPLNNPLPGQLVLVDKLPAGMGYVVGSAVPAPVITGTVATGQTLTWTMSNVMVNKDPLATLTFKATVPSDANPYATFDNVVEASSQGAKVTASASFVVPAAGYTTLKKTATTPVAPTVDGIAEDGWTIRMTSVDPINSAKTDTIDILPYVGDGRGTTFSGSYVLKEAVQAVAGATVYYTTAAPATLKEDPKDASNGGFATITGNTVGWSTTYNANATAVRVVGPALASGKTQDFTVRVVTSGSKGNDVFVNTAVGRASNTQLRMRTSDQFRIEELPAAELKKYVMDSSGAWHDAQDATDYPSYDIGDTARYRLVVENTGNTDLENFPVTDDKANLGQLFEDGKLTSDVPVTGNGVDGLTITKLVPFQKAVIEYDMVITEGAVVGNILVNMACVNPAEGSDPAFEESCDPAGVKVLSSLSWEKVSAYSATTFLDGSEWELIQVTGDGGDPVAGAAALAVTDCVAEQAQACTGLDIDPQAGRFKVKSLSEGWYRLVETKAPAGYKLDPTPHFVQVSGIAKIGEGIVNELHEPPMLPLTGGVGTLGFSVGGGLGGLLVAAGLFWQRRRSAAIA